MKNAHLRFGQLEFRQSTANIMTTLRVQCDCYMGESDFPGDGDEADRGLLLSVFGGDNEIAAVSAAVSSNSPFSLKFPDNETCLCICMGENASNMRGTILIPGLKHPVRHLVVVSQALRQNGLDGRTYLLNYSPETTWALMASVMGLPARPEWGDWIIDQLDAEKRISPLAGFGCDPYRVRATREELLEKLGAGVRTKELLLPAKNGPIQGWPEFTVSSYFQPVEIAA